MSDAIYFAISYVREDNIQKFDQLVPYLEKIGVKAAIKKSNETTLLEIEYDEDELHKHLTRSAGRYHKNIGLHKVSDIQQRRENGESVKDIAKELGISTATLYRRLKEAENDELGTIYL